MTAIALAGAALEGSPGSDSAFYVITLEDGGVTAAGSGSDFSWVLPSVLP